jgi:hypothetical protein
MILDYPKGVWYHNSWAGKKGPRQSSAHEPRIATARSLPDDGGAADTLHESQLTMLYKYSLTCLTAVSLSTEACGFLFIAP